MLDIGVCNEEDDTNVNTEAKSAIGMLTVLINLCLLALGLKLYTEYFKERVKDKGR